MRRKPLYGASARFWGDAFAAKPALAQDVNMNYRYLAACAAARAGSGKGHDAAGLGDKEKAQLRGQALEWLKATLAQRTKQLQSRKPQDRAEVQRTLRYWQRDPDLAGVRAQAALAKLPEAEREAWGKFWADVDQLVKKAPTKR
jgi:hypothetical protein